MSDEEPSELLTLFAADSLAKTSAMQERAKDLLALDQGSGANMHESFASWNPATSSWKTSQHSLLEDLTTFSERWPIAGTMRIGRVFARSTWVPRISETDSSLLPTPRAIYGEHAGMTDPRHLTGAVHLWPTPVASDGQGGPRKPDGKRGRQLKDYAGSRPTLLFPTPTASDAEGNGRKWSATQRTLVNVALGKGKGAMWSTPTASTGGAEPEGETGRKLVTQVGGALNPTWVEWLMGFPLGWTVLEPSATPSSRKSRKSSGK